MLVLLEICTVLVQGKYISSFKHKNAKSCRSLFCIDRYHCFAGREASRAMAKFSFDESDLCRSDIDDLGPFEKSTLDDWVDKYKYYKSYPIVGRVSCPPRDLNLTLEDLTHFKGYQSVPEGRIDAPIYVLINGKVLDVSYGGKEM